MRANRQARARRRSTCRPCAEGRRFLADDAAVSDVIGAILLVGITVGMMIGLSAIMLNLDGPRDRVHIDLRLSVVPGASGWGTGDEVVRIEHVGGEAMDRATARVRLTIDDTTVQIRGIDLDGGFSDGSFTLGDAWQRTQLILEGQTVELLVIDDGGNQVTTSTKLTARGSGGTVGGGTGGTSGIVTYVFSGSASTGTLSNFDAMKVEGGGSATLTEATSGGVATTVNRDSSTVVTSISMTNANNAFTSNDQRATMSAVGATIEVGGFTLPVTGVQVTNVYIGMEAQRGSGSGSGSLVQLSYEIDGVPGPVDVSNRFTVSSVSDATFIKEISGAKDPWLLTDIPKITVTAERVSGGRATLIDHLFVRVTYKTPVVTDAQATFGFTGVPGDCTSNHALQVRYRIAGETFTLQVQGDDGVWRTKAPGLTSGQYQFVSYTLGKSPTPSDPSSVCEWRGGAPQVRVLDADTGALPGSLLINYMRIDTT